MSLQDVTLSRLLQVCSNFIGTHDKFCFFFFGKVFHFSQKGNVHKSILMRFQVDFASYFSSYKNSFNYSGYPLGYSGGRGSAPH